MLEGRGGLSGCTGLLPLAQLEKVELQYLRQCLSALPLLFSGNVHISATFSLTQLVFQ